MASIAVRQLQPEYIELQCASAVQHMRLQRVEAVRLSIACLIAVAGIVAAFIPSIAITVAIVGLSWSVVSSWVIVPIARSLSRDATVVQELFDTELFGLDWNQGLAGERPPRSDVKALSRRLRSGSKRAQQIEAGWYDDLGQVPYPVDVLICQEQNVRWDWRLRKRYAALLYGCVGGWIAVGAIVGSLLDLGLLLTIVAWYVPSVAAVGLALEVAAKQRFVGSEKQRLAEMLSRVLEQLTADRKQFDKPKAITLARKAQDGIFLARQEAGRVPALVYQFFRGADEGDFDRASEAYRAQFDRARPTD